MNPDQIIRGCIDQNRRAQQALYDMYKGILFVLCLKYCRNEAEAEDTLHNTFIEIFTNIKKFKGSGSFEGWMKRIAINKAINCYKDSMRVVPLVHDISEDVSVDENEIMLTADQILEMIRQLPDQYRIVFCLYELDDYSHRDIAEMLSISEGTSKSNLHRAKAILKSQIKLELEEKLPTAGNGK